jgi:glycosyltransferase involved in cell wall biosynthesis
MGNMKVSLITTVLNEEKSIKSFLASVQGQARLPDEFIIVDGGSTDLTIERIKTHELKIKNLILIRKKGNRSTGRNEAIRHSTGSIIAVSDAGCILEKNWLKNIIKPLGNKDIDIASGFYRPIADSIFGKSLSAYTCVMPDKIDRKNFLPSSRSVDFRKEAWKKVG